MARDPEVLHGTEAALDKTAQAHSVFLRLVLPPYTIHFKSPHYMRDSTLDLLDRRVCKATLKATAATPSVRLAIGTDADFWADLVTLFRAAIPSLERRSFTIWDPSAVDYESTSGALIASSYPALWKDLERLNDLVSISRNILTIGPSAQDLAAAAALDHEIFRLINCCVRVTARGYDGEAGTGEEEKWQWIVNAYKKLLITSLQFLNNLVAQNETRKLLLWLSLFDHDRPAPVADYDAQGVPQFNPDDIPETSRTSLADVPSNPSVPPEPPLSDDDILLAYGLSPSGRTIPPPTTPLPPIPAPHAFPPHIAALVAHARSTNDLLGLVGNSYVYFGRKLHAVRLRYYDSQFQRAPTLLEEHEELKRQWAELEAMDVDHWDGLWDDVAARYRADRAVWEGKGVAARSVMVGGEGQREGKTGDGLAGGDGAGRGHKDRDLRRRVRELEMEIAEHLQLEGQLQNQLDGGEGGVPASQGVRTQVPHLDTEFALSGILHTTDLTSRPLLPDDTKMLFTAEAGTKILESGKVELMKRLSDYAPPDPGLPPSRRPDGVRTRMVRIDAQGRAVERTGSMSRSPSAVERREDERDVGGGDDEGSGGLE
ncbi:hypothetical protein LTR53_010835, partial [Teratosphaeriaceae sp. CCFEE 6253]